MVSVGDILNDDEFFGDVVDTPKEGIELHKKREELKGVIGKGKLGYKCLKSMMFTNCGKTL